MYFIKFTFSCHKATSALAASSVCLLQLRNNSVGRLLKFVQNDNPSHPNSHGSSTVCICVKKKNYNL